MELLTFETAQARGNKTTQQLNAYFLLINGLRIAAQDTVAKQRY